MEIERITKIIFLIFLLTTFTSVWSQEEILELDLSNYLLYSSPPDDFAYASENSRQNLRQGPLIVGINNHWDLGNKLDWVVQMGVSWIRTGAGWHAVEEEFSEPPKYNWEVADKIVADAEARKINVLYLLSYTPSWASYDGRIGGALKDEVARRHWRMFVRAIAERYRGRVRYWEIWNEPNNEKFWRGGVEEYINDILIPAVEELKTVDSENKIVGPSLETRRGARIKVENFFKKLAERNSAKYFDIISQNVYESFPDEVVRQFEKGDYECFWIFCIKKRDSLFKIYYNAGLGEKPIWLTEFGWRVDKVGERGQAEKIVNTLDRLSRRQRFGAAFIYCLQADEPWGIMRKDDTPRPIFWLLRDWLLGDNSDPPVEETEEDEEKLPSRFYLVPRN